MTENLLQIWNGLVAQNPEAPALIESVTNRTWSRSDISRAASQWLGSFSDALRASLKGRRVVMAEPNSPVWFQVFLGLLEAGAIPALADSKETQSRLETIAESCGAAAIWRENQLSIFSHRPAVRRSDLCLIKLTSGSTGTPKALVFTHAQMLADGRQIAASMDIRPDDVNLGVIPFGHSYGLGNLVVPLLEQGTAIVCAASPFPQSIAEECAKWRVTIFPAVPTLLRALSRADVAREMLASVRLFISAGAPLTPEEASVFAAKFGKHVHNFYGTSETGGISYDRSGSAAETGRGVGQLIEGVSLRWRRGKRFTVESAAVVGDGCFSPPDRGEIDVASGELKLLGRAGRTLKIAGRRLDPVEVEAALRALPGVRDAYVNAHPSRPDALAAVVAADEPHPQAVDLRRQLAARVAVWKIPDRLIVVSAFPVTERGKTDRAALMRLLEG